MSSYKEMFELKPEELFERLTDTFCYSIPDKIESKSDMDEAQRLMLQLSSGISFLLSLQSYAKIKKTEIKRYGDKVAFQDAVDKNEIIENAVTALKQQYSGLSRAVTIRQANLEEIRLSGRSQTA